MQRLTMVAVMLVLGIAGCGGSGGGREISRAAFVARADEACKIRTPADRSNASSGGKAAGNPFAASIATRRRVLAALNAIQAPEALKDTFDEYKSVYAARTRVYQQFAASMGQGGGLDTATAANAKALQAKSTRLRETLRLQVCP